MTDAGETRYSRRMTGKKQSRAPAIDKGMHILEALAAVHEPITMTGLAKQLGVSVSSIQRILAVLVEQGYVGKTGTNGYYLTDRIYRLAAARESEESLLYHSMEAMHGFVHRTSESIHLSIARAGQFVIIGQVNGTDLVRISIREGSYPLLDYPSGWVLLAFQAKEAWVSGEIPPEIRSAVEEVRNKGYGCIESRIKSSIYHLSVPVIGSYGTAVGALATTFAMRKEELTDADELTGYLVRHLQHAAAQIEKRIAPESEGEY